MEADRLIDGFSSTRDWQRLATPIAVVPLGSFALLRARDDSLSTPAPKGLTIPGAPLFCIVSLVNRNLFVFTSPLPVLALIATSSPLTIPSGSSIPFLPLPSMLTRWSRS